MCYTIKQTANERLLEGRFKARLKYPAQLEPIEKLSGFAFPLVPVITNKEMDSIQLFQWGLIPHWAKDVEIRKILSLPVLRLLMKNRVIDPM